MSTLCIFYQILCNVMSFKGFDIVVDFVLPRIPVCYFMDTSQCGPYTVTILSREKCMHYTVLRYAVISVIH